MTFPDTTFVDKSTVIQADWLNAVNDKCMETVSVKDFGAVGDGVTDDTAAIQAAIDSLTNGEVVLDGVFVVTTINMKSGVYLNSQNATIKLKDHSPPVAGQTFLAPTININSVNNTGIFGTLTINGNKANQDYVDNNGSHGVQINSSGCYNIFIDTLIVNNSSSDGLYIGNQTAPQNIVVQTLISNGAYRNGLSITGGKNLSFGYVECKNSGGGLIGAGVDIEPNNIAYVCQDIFFDQVVCYSNAWNGFQVLGRGDSHKNIFVKNLQSYNNSKSGLAISKCSHVTIENCNIYSNKLSGITIPDTCNNISVHGEIYLNGTRGIDFVITDAAANSNNFDFTNCKIYNNGIGSPNTYDGVRISTDGAYSINYVNFDGSYIYDNQISKTQRYGITSSDNVYNLSADAVIYGNVTGPYFLATVAGGNKNFITTKKQSQYATIDIGSISANSALTTTVTINGVSLGDVVVASPYQTLEGNLVWSAYVSAANTVALRVLNPTASPIDPGSRDWMFVIYSRIL